MAIQNWRFTERGEYLYNQDCVGGQVAEGNGISDWDPIKCRLPEKIIITKKVEENREKHFTTDL